MAARLKASASWLAAPSLEFNNEALGSPCIDARARRRWPSTRVDYSRFENLADSDEDEPPVKKDLTTKKLQELHRTDPQALDQMEAEVKATRIRLEEAKKLRERPRSRAAKEPPRNIQDNIRRRRKEMKG